MANFELPNDWVLTIPIQTTDAAGAVEPPPPGAVFTAVSTNPAALSATIGADVAGNPTLIVTPLMAEGSGITVTVSDNAQMTVATQVFDIISDTVDVNIVLDVANATHTAQAVPTT